MAEKRIVLYDLTYPELEAFVVAQGEPRFRARQLWDWMYRQLATDFDAMTNLPRACRERLAQTDRELVEMIAALERRAAQLRKEPVPAALTDLVGRREQVEAELRGWRGRCRRLGLALSLPRFDEYAGAAMDD